MNSINDLSPTFPRPTPLGGSASLGQPSLGGPRVSEGPSFADTLKSAVGEVAELQHEARTAVEDLQVGRTDDLAGVMTAVEKSDLAFKTLLAVRSKLMDAYEEIRNMPV